MNLREIVEKRAGYGALRVVVEDRDALLVIQKSEKVDLAAVALLFLPFAVVQKLTRAQ